MRTTTARPLAAAGLELTWRQRLSLWDLKSAPYLYISPFFILFMIVGLFPLIYTGYISLHNWNLVRGDLGFNGLDNFGYVLSQPRFGVALRNTFSIFLLSSVPQIIAAILIAAALDANLRAKTFWRMGVLLPYVVAPIAVALIFGQMFADQSGAINTVLGGLGIDPIGWHKDPFWSHVAIATMVNFRWTGYNALIFLAAMQAIPREVIEAAVVDGASRVQTFLKVTVPMLRPTIIFVVITSTIGGLQIFDEPRMFDTAGMGGADRLDAVAFFTMLNQVSPDARWVAAAASARGVIDAMVSGKGYLYTGSPDGSTLSTSPVPLDPQTWSWLALRDESLASGLDWARRNLATTDSSEQSTSQLPDGLTLSGVTFSDASLTSTASYNGIRVHRQGVWLEGTAQLACAYADRGRRGRANPYLAQLRLAQRELGRGQHVGGAALRRGGIVAASSLIDTGFGFGYFQIQHVGATGWYVLAELGANPMRLD